MRIAYRNMGGSSGSWRPGFLKEKDVLPMRKSSAGFK